MCSTFHINKLQEGNNVWVLKFTIEYFTDCNAHAHMAWSFLAILNNKPTSVCSFLTWCDMMVYYDIFSGPVWWVAPWLYSRSPKCWLFFVCFCLFSFHTTAFKQLGSEANTPNLKAQHFLSLPLKVVEIDFFFFFMHLNALLFRCPSFFL